jgi:hypothetical protein
MQVMMKLVEEVAGTGELVLGDKPLFKTRYRIRRHQGMAEGSGLPIPGLFRIEGTMESGDFAGLIGKSLGLRLEDGRLLAITIADHSGRVFSEGHGPMKCLCC